jgi:Lrp/AsnC family leucine-responsive transcriptional regulator
VWSARPSTRSPLAARVHAINPLTDVRLAPDQDDDGFEQAIEPLAIIVEATHLAGRADDEPRIVCRDTAQLDTLLRHLERECGASATETRVVLRTAIRRRPPVIA